MIRLENPHPGITLQDNGRTQGRELGHSKGGALDEISFTNANILLNNPRNSPAIEIILGGFQFEFTYDTTISLTGADLNFTLNNQPISPNTIYKITSGNLLKSSGPRNGLISYLGILGGFKGPKYFNSVSIPQRERSLFHDYNSQNFKYVQNSASILANEILPLELNPNQLEYFPSYQNSYFKYSELNFTKENRFDRMGIFLEGEGVKYCGQAIRSEGIAIGSLQVINERKIIALLNDCQTIGGYPKLGVLTHKSKCQLAQLKPGLSFCLKHKNTKI